MDSERAATKLGAAIYQKNGGPFQLADFVSDFEKRWPGVPLIAEGQQQNCAYFALITLERCHTAKGGVLTAL